VRDTWETYDEIAGVLDERMATFRRRGAAAAAAPLIAAPDPAPEPAPKPEPPAQSPKPEPPVAPPERSAQPPQHPQHPPKLPVKAPPPLPRAGATPHRTKHTWHRGTGGGRSGKFWLLAVVLVFLGVKACGALFDSQRDSGIERSRQRAEQARRRHRREVQRFRNERAMTRNRRARSTEPIRAAKWAALSPAQKKAAGKYGLPLQFENALGMRFVLIPPGTFIMGSPPGEADRRDDETLHNVVLSGPCYLQTTEVSNALFRRYKNSHRSYRPGGGLSLDQGPHPATSLSHEEALAFCAWLGKLDAERDYTLPTEAQWEYACRAGTHTRFWWGENELPAGMHANVADETARLALSPRIRTELQGREDWRWFKAADANAGPAPVGSYAANPWGLYDMLGNAAEWCADWDGPYREDAVEDPRGPPDGRRRIVRGGSYETALWRTRCASRDGIPPTDRRSDLGFRVVCTPTP